MNLTTLNKRGPFEVTELQKLRRCHFGHGPRFVEQYFTNTEYKFGVKHNLRASKNLHFTTFVFDGLFRRKMDCKIFFLFRRNGLHFFVCLHGGNRISCVRYLNFSRGHLIPL